MLYAGRIKRGCENIRDDLRYVRFHERKGDGNGAWKYCKLCGGPGSALRRGGVFCAADAYDAGYLSPEDVAGRVEVKGRGGIMLQPGIDLLEHAKDFPKDGPILIITDGEIEDKLTIRRKHAYLIPKGKNLPFRAKGKVFYFL